MSTLSWESAGNGVGEILGVPGNIGSTSKIQQHLSALSRQLGQGLKSSTHLETSIVGEVDDNNLHSKGVVKEGLHQTISVNRKVAISRRVERYRLALGA